MCQCHTSEEWEKHVTKEAKLKWKNSVAIFFFLLKYGKKNRKKKSAPAVRWNHLKVVFVTWTLIVLALVSLWHSDHPHSSNVGISVCMFTVPAFCLFGLFTVRHSYVSSLVCLSLVVFYLSGWPLLLLTSWVGNSSRFLKVISRLFEEYI